MKTTTHALCLALLLAFAAGGAGCIAVAAAGAAGATVAYVRGNTEGLIEAGPRQVLAATEAVFEAMTFEVTDREGEEGGDRWQLKGKSDSGESVKVTIQQVAPQVCRVWVRVGMFGDEQYSRTIFERIKSQL